MFNQLKRVEGLEEDLRLLRNKVQELESAGRRLELEYVDLYDKVKRQMSRMAKRYAVDQADAAGPPDPESEDLNATGLDPISAKIIARRGTRLGRTE